MTAMHVAITREDRWWHDAFHTYVSRVFPSISFRASQQHGGWDERYTAYACVDGEEIVASASVCEMELVLCGQRTPRTRHRSSSRR